MSQAEPEIAFRERAERERPAPRGSLPPRRVSLRA
jgi:hypothetical protein